MSRMNGQEVPDSGRVVRGQLNSPTGAGSASAASWNEFHSLKIRKPTRASNLIIHTQPHLQACAFRALVPSLSSLSHKITVLRATENVYTSLLINMYTISTIIN
jgi:hypothetical protein